MTSDQHRIALLFMLLPLLGYIVEPTSSLTMTYRHPRGTRIGINLMGDIWYNT